MESFGFVCQQNVGREGAKPLNIFPFCFFLLWELSSSCWPDQEALWCVTGASSSKNRPRGAPLCACVWECVCVRVCVCTFPKHWAHIQHLCLGCVWSPGGHSRVNSGSCECWTSGQLCASLSAPLQPLHSRRTTHTPLPPFSDCTAVWKHTLRSLGCCWRLLLMQETGEHVHEDLEPTCDSEVKLDEHRVVAARRLLSVQPWGCCSSVIFKRKSLVWLKKKKKEDYFPFSSLFDIKPKPVCHFYKHANDFQLQTTEENTVSWKTEHLLEVSYGFKGK